MNLSKVIFDRTRAKNGYWCVVRDADEKALFMIAVRGASTNYTKEEIQEMCVGLVSACKEDRIEWRSE